jgi:hypothetical protein
MSDFDFLKSFGENLGKEQPFEPAEGEWEKVAATIDKQAAQARFWRLGSRWAVGTAAVVALMALGWGWYHTTQKIEDLQHQVLRLQQRQQMNEVLAIHQNTDHNARNSGQKRTIVIHDTIYRTVVVQQKMQVNVAQSDFVPVPGNKSSLVTASHNTGAIPTDEVNWDKNQAIAKKNQANDNSLTQNTKKGTQNTNHVPTSPNPSNEEQTTPKEVEDFVAPLPIDTPASIPTLQPQITIPVANIQWPADPIADVPAPVVIKPVSRKPLALSFSMGYTAGVLFTKSLDPEKFNAIPTGLQTELGLGKHFRLRATAEYLCGHYSIEKYGEHDSYIPPLPPLNSNDKLHYVNGQQVLWDFTLGARYLFSLGKNQRAFISAAWLNEQAGEQALQYEFKDPGTGEETHLIREAHDTKFHNQFVQVGAGMEWTLWRGLTLQTEAVYQRQVPVTIPLLSERLGLKMGLSYRF